jgi:hypothetical protein
MGFKAFRASLGATIRLDLRDPPPGARLRQSAAENADEPPKMCS